ncbi:hypothetical protein [Amycolatopsis sp. 3B14]|uniref:hypothetical protein n=1 Tax=Amycolatopsis sp. 3B14 TaxID=3243600 RepID=UPI003D99EE6F
MTSPNFRKTATTLLDDAVLTVREIADQLGLKRVIAEEAPHKVWERCGVDHRRARDPEMQKTRRLRRVLWSCCLNQTRARRDSNP